MKFFTTIVTFFAAASAVAAVPTPAASAESSTQSSNNFFLVSERSGTPLQYNIVIYDNGLFKVTNVGTEAWFFFAEQGDALYYSTGQAIEVFANGTITTAPLGEHIPGTTGFSVNHKNFLQFNGNNWYATPIDGEKGNYTLTSTPQGDSSVWIALSINGKVTN